MLKWCKSHVISESWQEYGFDHPTGKGQSAMVSNGSQMYYKK